MVVTWWGTVNKCGFFILELPFSTVKKFSRHTVTRGIVQILYSHSVYARFTLLPLSK